MAIARTRTINGVPYFCHAGLRLEGPRSTTLGAVAGIGDGAAAGADDVAMFFEALLSADLRDRLLQLQRRSCAGQVSEFAGLTFGVKQ